MRVVRGWSTATLVSREEVFDGLIAKAVRMTLRPITLNLSSIVVAAAGPQLSTTSSEGQPIITTTAGGTITALWDGYVDAELAPYLQQTFLDSAAQVLTGMESALDGSIPQITDSYAQAYLANATNRLKGISDTIWQAVRAELQLGLDDGEGMQQLAARVRKTANVMPNRAVVIARTEVHNAAEAGSLAQVQLGGFTDEECSKRWLATDDVRTREAHRKADGQVVGLSQPFIVGGEGLQRPGDPLGSAENVIQCRCTMEFLFTDDADLNDGDEDLDFDLITAAKDADGWEELDHPRGPDGKFIKKGSAQYFEALAEQNKAKNEDEGDYDPAFLKMMEKAQKKKKPSSTSGTDHFDFDTVENMDSELFEDWAISFFGSDVAHKNSLTTWNSLTSAEQTLIRDKAYNAQADGHYVVGHMVADFDEMNLANATFKPKVVPGVSMTGDPLMDALVDQEALAKASQPKKKTIVAKPLKINTNVIYKQEYADGAVVAERDKSEDGYQGRLVWNAGTKKFDYQERDVAGPGEYGTWVTQDSYGKGAAYKKFSTQHGWTTPAMAQQEAADAIFAKHDKSNIVVKEMTEPPTYNAALISGMSEPAFVSWFYEQFSKLGITEGGKKFNALPNDVQSAVFGKVNDLNNKFSKHQINSFINDSLTSKVQVGYVVDPDEVGKLIDDALGGPTVTPLTLTEASEKDAQQYFVNLTPEQYSDLSHDEKIALSDYAAADFGAGNDFATKKLLAVKDAFIKLKQNVTGVTSFLGDSIDIPAVASMPVPAFNKWFAEKFTTHGDGGIMFWKSLTPNEQMIVSDKAKLAKTLGFNLPSDIIDEHYEPKSKLDINAIATMGTATFGNWFFNNFLDQDDEGHAQWNLLSPTQQEQVEARADLAYSHGYHTPKNAINAFKAAQIPDTSEESSIPYPDFEDMHIVALNTWYQNLTKEQYDNFEAWEQEGIWDQAKEADDDFGNPKPIESLQALTGMLGMGQQPTTLPNFTNMILAEKADWFDTFTQADYDKLNSDEVLKVVTEAAKLNAAGWPDGFKKISSFSDNASPSPGDTDSSLDDDLGFVSTTPVVFSFFEDPLNLPNMVYSEKVGFFNTLTPEMWQSFSEAQKDAVNAVANDMSNPSLAGFAQSKLVAMPGKGATSKNIDQMTVAEFKVYAAGLLGPGADPSDLYWDTSEKLGITTWAEQLVGKTSPHGTGNLVVKGQPIPTAPVAKLDLYGLKPEESWQAVHTYAVATVKPAHDIGVPDAVPPKSPAAFNTLTSSSAGALQDSMLKQAGVTWTPKQIDAVGFYTTSVGYQSMNAVLRNDQKRMKLFSSAQLANGAEKAIELQSAMTPLTGNVVLHRGTGAQAFGFGSSSISTASLKKLEGEVIKDRGFVSTSVVPPTNVGYDYAKKPIKILVRAPKGTPALFVTSATPSWSKENEMILGAGLNYRIDEVREADASDKATYGSGIEQVVIMTVVPDDGTPTDQIKPGTKVKTPSGVKVTPAPVAAAPTPPIKVTPAKGNSLTPVKLNTAGIYKTSYAVNQIVAVRIAPLTPNGPNVVQRLTWNGKKFVLSVPNSYVGGWVVQQAYTKKDAFDTFKNDTDWFTPNPGAMAGALSSGFFSPTEVAEKFNMPVAPTTVVPNAPTMTTPSLTVEAILTGHGGLPAGFKDADKNKIYAKFKTTSGYGTMMVGKPSDVVFKALATAVAQWNKDNPFEPLNHLQVLKLIDEISAQKGGVPNGNLYEKKILDWLQISAGQKQAANFIKQAEAAVLAPPSSTTTPKSTTATSVAQALAQIPNAYDIGTPAVLSEDFKDSPTNFPNMSPAQAAAMNTAMRKKTGAITSAQVSAIKSYTGSGSVSINNLLRYPTKSGGSVHTATQAKLIQESMYPIPKSITVHRGTEYLGNDISSHLSITELQQYVGKTFSDGSFFSASVGKAAAFGSKKFQMQIELPAGTPAAYIKSVSGVPHENEILLGAGLHYKILSIEKVGFIYNVRVRVVNPS